MLDMKFVRENLDAVRTMLKNRCNALDLSSFTELDERRTAVGLAVVQNWGCRRMMRYGSRLWP